MAKFYRRFIRIDGKLTTSPRFVRKADADKWFDEMRRKKQFHRDGISMGHSKNDMTFMEYAQIWFNRRQNTHAQATWSSDDQRLRDYVLPLLGERPIGSITHQTIRSLLLAVTDSGKSIQTRTRVQALLSCIFSDAFNEDPPLIMSNPVAGIRFKDRRMGKKEPVFIKDPNDVIKFLKKARELGRLHLAVCATFLMTGLRKSEAIALTWDSIDFDSNTILVKRKVEQVSMEVKDGTKRGVNVFRAVPASSEYFAIMANFKIGSKFKKDTDFVFCRESDGRFIGPRDAWKIVKEVREKAEVYCTVHGLRHTFGREFAERSGNLKALQAMLGHASSSTTDLYSDLAGERLKQFGSVVSYGIADKRSKTES